MNFTPNARCWAKEPSCQQTAELESVGMLDVLEEPFSQQHFFFIYQGVHVNVK